MTLLRNSKRVDNEGFLGTDCTKQLPLRCMFCCKEDRLISFHGISEGDHIKQQGENFSFSFRKKLRRFYDHHMIVKEVHNVVDGGKAAILTLIEFTTTPYDKTPKIRERTVMKHLFYDEIYVIKYCHKTHSPQEIIRRGTKLMKEDIRYNLLFRNCEHVARWCVCGNATSFQVKNVLEHGNLFLRELSFQVKNVLEHRNLFLRVLNKYCDRIAALTWDDILVTGNLPVLGCIVLVGIILHELEGVYTDTKVLAKLLECGDICQSCCKRRKIEIRLKFAILVITQTGGLIGTSFLSHVGSQIGFGILMSIFTTLLVKGVPKFIKRICSPFIGKKVLVDSFHKICVGDVISWREHGFYHDGIITSISVLPRCNAKKANLSIIHYTSPGLRKEGKVVEEALTMDLDREKPRLHDYANYNVNEPEEVVQRARQRLGETKFGLTNRSAHFCHWAKLNHTEESETKSKSTEHCKMEYLCSLDPESDVSNLHPVIINHERTMPFIPIERPITRMEIDRERAVIRDDIQAGQLVRFSFRNLPHYGVCTAVRPGDKPSIVLLDVVHYGTSKRVSEETFTFDLNKVDVIVVKIHPLYKFKTEDIIRRARARVGRDGYDLLRHRSRHLAEEIVYKDKDKRIYSYCEVKPGDCIVYKYWHLPHQAVVVGKEQGQAKGNNEGYLILVHYALDWFFGTRYITRERVFFNLTETSVVVKAFPGRVVYPDHEVVQRALNRVGEQKFSVFGNISSDVVHWAKVVQTPCIVGMLTTDVSDTPSYNRINRQRYLLLPKLGKAFDKHFQKDWIKTWDELFPGMIVRKNLEFGIVSEVREQNKELKVIKNVRISGNEKRVTETSLELDLRTDYIYVFRCDPRVACRPSVSIRLAKLWLGKRIRDLDNWQFCKACVLKH